MGHSGFVGQAVFAGLAHQGTQLLAVSVRVGAQPLGQGGVVLQQAVTPMLGHVQSQGLFGAAIVLHIQRSTNGLHLVFVEFAHQLANKLHLTALAFEVGDFFRLADGFMQSLGHVFLRHQLQHRVLAQFQQILTQFLQLGALALHVGFAG